MGLFADFMLKQDAADSHSHNDIEKLSAGLSFLSASSAEDQVCLYLLSVRLAKEGAPQNIGHLSELAAGNPSRISEVLQDKASVDDFIRSCS